MYKLFECEITISGDDVVIKNFDNSAAVVVDVKYVEYNGEKLTFNQWEEKVTGWCLNLNNN